MSLIKNIHLKKLKIAIQADDREDTEAEKRFNAKELDLFESALRSFMSESFIRATVEHFYEDDTEEEENNMVSRLLSMMDRIEIRREDY